VDTVGRNTTAIKEYIFRFLYKEPLFAFAKKGFFDNLTTSLTGGFDCNHNI